MPYAQRRLIRIPDVVGAVVVSETHADLCAFR
jgi:hypothetical protein